MKNLSAGWATVLVPLLVGALASCAGDDSGELLPDSTELVPTARADTLVVELIGDTGSVGFLPGEPVSVDPETIEAIQGQYIRWRNPFQVPVRIHLERAPVTPTLVEVPARGSISVRVLLEAPGGTYKYEISWPVGDIREVLDPYIDIPPPPATP